LFAKICAWHAIPVMPWVWIICYAKIILKTSIDNIQNFTKNKTQKPE
ncbi:27981_t:CDS:1, partial [Racocetra persica]